MITKKIPYSFYEFDFDGVHTEDQIQEDAKLFLTVYEIIRGSGSKVGKTIADNLAKACEKYIVTSNFEIYSRMMFATERVIRDLDEGGERIYA